MSFKFIDHNLTDLKTSTAKDGTRKYTTPEGKTYPSVSTVTKLESLDAIKKWRKRVGDVEANRISSQSATRGTSIHKLCENYMLGKPMVFKTPVEQELFGTIKPYFSNLTEIHAQESCLYSNYLQVAGRTDLIGNYSGKISVVDFKTSNKVKRVEWIGGYFMQAAAYSVCFEERTGIPVSQLVIIMAVEQNDPQVFIEKRDNWIFKFIELREKYREVYGQ